MSAKELVRLADLQGGPDDLAALGEGVRGLRAIEGSDAQVEALAARLGAELASNTVAGSAVLSSALLRLAWIGVSAVGLGLGAWLWWSASSADETAAPRSPAVVAAPQHVLSAAPPRPAASPVLEPPIAPQLAETARPAPSPPARVAGAAASRPRAEKRRLQRSDPEAELALLGRAQALLDSDPAAALDVLAEHARSYTRGVFIEEREVLALEAESKLGQKALARARAERFIDRYPRSAHARRVRTLLEPQP